MRGLKLPAPAAYALSAALHAAAFLLVARVPALAPPARDLVPLELVERAPAPPPEAPPPPAPRARIRHSTALAPPRDAPEPPAPAPEPPPPPNAPPPDDAPPPARAPVRIGVSMSSTSTSGGVAAPVGNTLYGEMPRTAPDPSEVRPYRSERYVPPTQVTVLPRLLAPCRPPSDEYPEAAGRLGVEGRVVLVVTVDEKGAIADVRVIEDPGHGLGAAAAASVRRHCRFAAARKGDEPVATSFRFPVTFELP